MNTANLHPNSLEAYKLLHDGVLSLQRMEQSGFRINRKYVSNTIAELEEQIVLLEREFKESDFCTQWKKFAKKEINIHSSKQLGDYLYKALKIHIPKVTQSGEGSTDEEALGQLGIPELKKLVEIKKLKKTKDTYLVSFLREQVDGFIHPHFHLHLVRSYRSSASEPNIQNQPKRDPKIMKLVRKALYPRRGHQLVEFDYGQLEVRISCAYHKDPNMIKYVTDPTTDMHRDVAQQIFFIKKYDKTNKEHKDLRFITKSFFVFAQFYGDYFAKCAVNIVQMLELPKKGKWKKGQGIKYGDGYISDWLIKNGITELGHAKKNDRGKYEVTGFMKHLKEIEDDFWGNRFPVYAAWKKKWYAEYCKKGYAHSLTGFTYQGLMSKNDITNYPIQGSAFHVLLWSINQLMKAQVRDRWGSELISEIHDSLIYDVEPKELKKLVNIVNCVMCNDTRQHFKWINVPLMIEASVAPVDKSWADVEDYKIE